jgi:hypothetical protein
MFYIKHDLDQFIIQHEENPRIFIYLENIILMQSHWLKKKKQLLRKSNSDQYPSGINSQLIAQLFIGKRYI